jgi:DNA-binding response OmpR family regulator
MDTGDMLGSGDPDGTEDAVVEVREAVVIEDDADIRGLLAEVLQQAGFTVHAAATGVEGVEAVREHQPVVTTLDVSMPGIDGFETARRIRELSDTYLIMVTARAEEIEILQGLQSGADDYVTKPFRPRELRARIEAMLRRPRSAPAMVAGDPQSPPTRSEADDTWLEHGALRVEPSMRIARVDGTDLDLTRSEFDILVELLTAQRRVVTKSELALVVRGERDYGGYVSEQDERAIEVHVANLRRKLGDSVGAPKWIETVRGVGYRTTAD